MRNDLEVRLPPGDVRDDMELAKAANDALTGVRRVTNDIEVRADAGQP